ncbi:helix-turn-helix transcriptional regulator [Amycolatopsis rubida]|uniref:Helix-turn-helix transcriptional regulator n=1 Tax=Amycolatopsis rubida TaxID=112413 RepID=A0ABX0BMM5_9PSEU|nr:MULTISPECIES: Scr1 family TA system antitoxin-like transcriptional regulator [Amycolatopsis]MYW89610.1 helix-turn-helix domain-containing protein [Amycolatopsis rubida]NEC54587.1 helix-turn-helix transcriptional regulator [Amycolatopsis rubida]OAP25662.1 Helix-turn-helix domain protein [Amycolatopsis sp. M39]
MRGSAMYTPRLRILGAELRAAREAACYGLNELARKIGVDNGLLSSWEHAKRCPSSEDVASILGALGVAGDTRDRIMALARGITAADWITYGSPTTGSHQDAIRAHERDSVAVLAWHPIFIPPLVQVPAYTWAVFSSEQVPSGVINTHAETLLSRREELAQRRTPVEIFIGEQALYAAVGDHATQSKQLDYLTNQTLPRHWSVRVLPVNSGWVFDGFTRYTMADATAVTYCAHRTVGVFLSDQSNQGQPAPYQHAADWLRAKALEPSQSVRCIASATGRAVPAS